MPDYRSIAVLVNAINIAGNPDGIRVIADGDGVFFNDEGHAKIFAERFGNGPVIPIEATAPFRWFVKTKSSVGDDNDPIIKAIKQAVAETR